MSNPNAHKYGQYYWMARVPKAVSPDGEIYFHADKVTIDHSGAMIAWRSKEGQTDQPTLVLASGQWLVFFAASVMGGHAVCVEHWKGEIS